MAPVSLSRISTKPGPKRLPSSWRGSRTSEPTSKRPMSAKRSMLQASISVQAIGAPAKASQALCVSSARSGKSGKGASNPALAKAKAAAGVWAAAKAAPCPRRRTARRRRPSNGPKPSNKLRLPSTSSSKAAGGATLTVGVKRCAMVARTRRRSISAAGSRSKWIN